MYNVDFVRIKRLFNFQKKYFLTQAHTQLPINNGYQYRLKFQNIVSLLLVLTAYGLFYFVISWYSGWIMFILFSRLLSLFLR